MSVLSTKKTFEIKTASLAIVEFFPLDANLELLQQNLKQQYADSNFFEQQPTVINTTKLANAARLNLASLLQLLRQINLLPLGITTSSTTLIQQAKELGLPLVTPQTSQRLKSTTLTATARQPTGAQPTVLIDKPIRAGQRIYAKGSDLVITAAVNHGAEIMADGNIHVYAALRGRALAGANGNRAARLFINRLDAELVSIAGFYRTSETAWPHNLHGQAVQISLQDDKLLFTALDEK